MRAMGAFFIFIFVGIRIIQSSKIWVGDRNPSLSSDHFRKWMTAFSGFHPPAELGLAASAVFLRTTSLIKTAYISLLSVCLLLLLCLHARVWPIYSKSSVVILKTNVYCTQKTTCTFLGWCSFALRYTNVLQFIRIYSPAAQASSAVCV